MYPSLSEDCKVGNVFPFSTQKPYKVCTSQKVLLDVTAPSQILPILMVFYNYNYYVMIIIIIIIIMIIMIIT